jgi:hypothetical protein
MVIQSVYTRTRDFSSFSQGYLMGRNENCGFEWRPIIDGETFPRISFMFVGFLFAMG